MALWATAIRLRSEKLIQNDKVEAIIILPRELFITTDISVTLWILNQNKKGGAYHGRMLRSRAGEILFMDLRTWTENPVKTRAKESPFKQRTDSKSRRHLSHMAIRGNRRRKLCCAGALPQRQEGRNRKAGLESCPQQVYRVYRP